MWPFRKHDRAGRRGRHDSTGHILSWAKRTLNDPVYGTPAVPGLPDSPKDVSDTDAQSGDRRSSVQDPWQDGLAPTHHEVATAREGDGVQAEPGTEVAEEPDAYRARAEPSTAVVVVTTQSPEASEGEAHIFADAQEAKLFVERLIDDGFDRERIKTIRGGPAHFNLSFRAVVDFD
jgi:hypothetical protein